MVTTPNLQEGQSLLSNVRQIAAVCAAECFGVVGMAYKNTADELVSLLRFGAGTKGVKIKLLEPGNIEIDLYVIMEFGTRLVAVAESLIDSVRYNVEKQAPVKVRRVHVHVQYVRI